MSRKKIFLSHRGADQAAADEVAAILRDLGHHVFDMKDWKPGAPFMAEMNRSLKEADHMIALASASYWESGMCQVEIEVAMRMHRQERKGFLYAFRIEDHELEPLYSATNWGDFTKGVDRQTLEAIFGSSGSDDLTSKENRDSQTSIFNCSSDISNGNILSNGNFEEFPSSESCTRIVSYDVVNFSLLDESVRDVVVLKLLEVREYCNKYIISKGVSFFGWSDRGDGGFVFLCGPPRSALEYLNSFHERISGEENFDIELRYALHEGVVRRIESPDGPIFNGQSIIECSRIIEGMSRDNAYQVVVSGRYKESVSTSDISHCFDRIPDIIDKHNEKHIVYNFFNGHTGIEHEIVKRKIYDIGSIEMILSNIRILKQNSTITDSQSEKAQIQAIIEHAKKMGSDDE